MGVQLYFNFEKGIFVTTKVIDITEVQLIAYRIITQTLRADRCAGKAVPPPTVPVSIDGIVQLLMKEKKDYQTRKRNAYSTRNDYVIKFRSNIRWKLSATLQTHLTLNCFLGVILQTLPETEVNFGGSETSQAGSKIF